MRRGSAGSSATPRASRRASSASIAAARLAARAAPSAPRRARTTARRTIRGRPTGHRRPTIRGRAGRGVAPPVRRDRRCGRGRRVTSSGHGQRHERRARRRARAARARARSTAARAAAHAARAARASASAAALRSRRRARRGRPPRAPRALGRGRVAERRRSRPREGVVARAPAAPAGAERRTGANSSSSHTQPPWLARCLQSPGSTATRRGGTGARANRLCGWSRVLRIGAESGVSLTGIFGARGVGARRRCVPLNCQRGLRP